MQLSETKAWQAAEWEYEQLHVMDAMPMLGPPPSPEDRLDIYKEITRRCPRFFPAVIELGLHELQLGRGKRAENRVERGLRLLLEHDEPEHMAEHVEAIIDNLETLWRFDCSRRLLREHIIPRFPHDLQFQDALAHAEAMHGNLAEAIRVAGEIAQAAPENYCYWSNLGWYQLQRGELQTAEAALSEAAELEPDDVVLQGNLEILDWMSRHDASYLEYLTRPADQALLDEKTDEDDWETVADLSRGYHGDWLKGWALFTFRERARQRRWIADTLNTLSGFFGFVAGLCQESYLLHTDLGYLSIHFETIMHKFIFKHGDVDADMIEGVYRSLLSYYRFFRRRRLVEAAELREFRQTALDLKPGLLEKMSRYNTVRHDHALSEQDREAMRRELFGVDHLSPFL